MTEDTFGPPLGEAARRLVRRKAHELVRQGKAGRQEVEDVEQALLAALVARWRRTGSTCWNWPALARVVVRTATADLLRRRRAKKRARPALSLDAPDEADGPLAWAVAAEGGDARKAWPHRTNEDRSALRQDVSGVLSGLPPALRELAALLSEATLSEAARQLGVPRTTLYARVRELRRRFERAGLRAYL